MSSKFVTFATLALAASAAPVVVVRDESPKPAKTGSGSLSGLGKGGSGSSSLGSSSSFAGLDGKLRPQSFASTALTIFEALTNLGMMSSSDVKKGDFPCKKAALLFARGTGEPGNMGYVVGPGLGTGLKKAMNGDVLIQGVDYSSKHSS